LIRPLLLPGLLSLLTFVQCSDPAPNKQAAVPAPLRFVDVSAAAGINFLHRTGAAGTKYLIETMGSGVCAFDYDADGRTDLYFVQSAPLPEAPPDPLLHAALFRNLGNGKFSETTGPAGVGNPGRYGMGCAVADVDNDGDEDLYVTNFGPNTLYRNNGDGTFTDVSRRSGTDNPLWGTAAAFADYDSDGDVDLFVGNYLDFTLAKHKRCGDVARNLVSYCHPDAYGSVPNVLYRNNGDGTFTDVTREAGLWNLEGKTLGALWTDYDQDGDVDLFVANDSVRNFLYRNNSDGTFTEVTLASGTGYSEEGRPEAGMGVDAADVNDDGRMDLFVTHLSNEVNELYLNNGNGTFTNGTNAAGLGAPSLLYVGWGTAFFDADNDADPDLYVTNGHVMDDIEAYSDSITYRERDFLFVNNGTGRFSERGVGAGALFQEQDVGRGMTVLDFDSDGRLDVALSRNGGSARLVHNETPTSNHWVSLRLRGQKSNRDGIGAWITLTAGGRRQVAERRSGFSYLSDSDGIVHFGLGASSGPVDVEIRWPSGLKETFRVVQLDRTVTLTEGSGLPRVNR
jgi:enediyne biosynthesis protein E4